MKQYIMKFVDDEDGVEFAIILNEESEKVSSKRMAIDEDLEDMRLKQYATDELALDGIVTVQGGVEIGCIRGSVFHGYGTIAFAQYKRDSAEPRPVETSQESLQAYHMELKNDSDGFCQISVFDQEGDVVISMERLYEMDRSDVRYEHWETEIWAPDGVVTMPDGFIIGCIVSGVLHGYETMAFKDFLASDEYAKKSGQVGVSEKDESLDDIYSDDFVHSVGGFASTRGNNKGRPPKWKLA